MHAPNDQLRPLQARIAQEVLPLIEYSHSDAKVSLPTTKYILFIKVRDISYFRADDVYAVLYDVHGNSHYVTRSMKWIEERLRFSTFHRVHKSYFINLYNVAQYTRADGGGLIMECGNEVPVSRRKRNEISMLLGL